MILTYLWVENYKDIIIQQGFNFGSSYIYKMVLYDGNYALTRQENKDNVEGLYSVFGASSVVNLSAIVGENGVGKTLLLECIMDSIAVSGHQPPPLTFAIYEDNDNTYILPNFSFKLPIEFPCDQVLSRFPRSKDVIFYSPIYDFRSRNIWNHVIDISSNNLLLSVDNELYDNSLNKFLFNPIYTHRFSNFLRDFSFVNESSLDSPIWRYIQVPESVIISISNMNENDYDIIRWPDEYKQVLANVNSWQQTRFQHYENTNFLIEDSAEKIIVDAPRDLGEIYFNFLDSLFKHLLCSFQRANVLTKENLEQITPDINIKLAIKLLLDASKQKFDGTKVINLIECFRKALSNTEGLYYQTFYLNIKDVKELLTAYREYLENPPISGNKLKEIRTTYEIFNEFPAGFIQFNWGYDLSAGEKAFLGFFARFHYAAKKIPHYIEYQTTKKEIWSNVIYILIDEGELGFHLQWQKEYISSLLSVLPKLFTYIDKDGKVVNPKLQIILTTHSPICLSDIPRYNIVYLKKINQRFNILTDVERPDKSFGANIHDIIHDSFFLQNGFIGSFAQDIITKIFKWYKGEIELTEDQIVSIINIIDEPIIKIKLSEMYAEKVGRFSIEKVRLELQIENLQKRLDWVNRNNNGEN